MRDMLDREELLPVEKALKLLLNYAPFKIPVEVSLPIDESYKMVISRDITSPEDLPSFSRSTVDGFAVNSSDTFGATESMPSYLTIIAEILMGERPEFGIKKGECAKIATGGMLPEGADSVVMFEHTQQIDGKMLEILKPVSPGENVIPVGEDARRDECILRTGHRLRPQDIGALAGLGMTDVWVYERPRVSIVSTGDEIVPADKSVKPGQVRDINSYTLSGLISDSGGIPVKKGIFSDRYEIIKDVVNNSLKSSDMVLITGGSSVGTKDVTSKVIDDLGKPGVLFHGVSLKPGKPMIGKSLSQVIGTRATMRPMLPWSCMMMLHHSPDGVSTMPPWWRVSPRSFGLVPRRLGRRGAWLGTPRDSPWTMRSTTQGPSIESARAII